MKVYEIVARHSSPDDYLEATVLYALANNEPDILVKIERSYTHGMWKERSDHARKPYEIYDDNYNVVGTESYMERMLRLRGAYNDDDDDDTYYGVTQYGWCEGAEISETDAATLLRLGVAEDWRTAPSACDMEA